MYAPAALYKYLRPMANLRGPYTKHACLPFPKIMNTKSVQILVYFYHFNPLHSCFLVFLVCEYGGYNSQGGWFSFM